MWQDRLRPCAVFTETSEGFAPYYLAGIRHDLSQTTAIHALRDRVERTFAWEDKFKRLLLRFEHIQQRHYGMKLMAYTLINLRRFCRA